jgi:multidrug efflux pump subunit AcrA (membrane-fusion protein)
MGKQILAVVAVLLVTGLAFFGYRRWQSADTATAATAELHFVRPGVLEVTIDAAGNLQPARETELIFEAAGRVTEVLVAPGDSLNAGQPLARLDPADLELERDAAAASLTNAERSLAAAQADLTDLADGPDEVEIALSQISVNSAKDGLWSKQMSRDAICGRVEAGRAQTVDCDQAEAGVLQGEGSVQSAELQHAQLLAGATRRELRDAQSRVDQAASQLATARTQLARAERDLAGATLTAPFTGTVMSMLVAEGDRVSANQAAASMADLSQLQIEVLLGETDVAKVTAGQPANITVDAFSDVTLVGEVVGVSPAPETVSGVVLYPVIVGLAPGDLPLRSGMTASAAIVTTREEAVLTIPLRAVQTEGGVSVVRVADAWPRPEGMAAALGGEDGGGDAAFGGRGARGRAAMAGANEASDASSDGTSAGSAVGEGPTGTRAGRPGGPGGPGGGDPDARATRRAQFAAQGGAGRPGEAGAEGGAGGFGGRAGSRGVAMPLSVPAEQVTSRAVPVTLGTRTDTVVVITEGLSPGDVVVIERAAVNETGSAGSAGRPPGGSSMAVPFRMGGGFRGR